MMTLTIYREIDHAGGYYSVQRWRVRLGSAKPADCEGRCGIGRDLDALRKAIQDLEGARTCIPREDNDDPSIIETWF